MPGTHFAAGWTNGPSYQYPKQGLNHWSINYQYDAVPTELSQPIFMQNPLNIDECHKYEWLTCDIHKPALTTWGKYRKITRQEFSAYYIDQL